MNLVAAGVSPLHLIPNNVRADSCRLLRLIGGGDGERALDAFWRAALEPSAPFSPLQWRHGKMHPRLQIHPGAAHPANLKCAG